MPLKRAREWSLEEAAGAPYDLQELAGPFLAGRAMVAYRSLSEGWLTGGAVHALTLAKNGVPQFMALDIPEAPQVQAALDALGEANSTLSEAALDPKGRPGIRDYHAAYVSGAASPVQVAEAIIGFVSREQGAANWLSDFDPEHLRAQAAASAARYAAGAPLSVLDGVPFAVKDAVDAFPLRTGHGTSFLGDMDGPVADVALEAPCVAALRSLGAVCVGKTQMQEFGLLPTGLNPRLGLTRNPHHLSRIAGGSSGGSACVVAAGVCAFAIGTDGGGSVRIPASLCGVVGLKPTQGRMASDAGTCALITLGPLATSVGDAMIVYAAMACPGSCALSPLKPAAAPGIGEGSGLAAARTAEQAQAEVDAAAAAVKAAAAAPFPEAAMGEDAATRPPLVLPRRLLAEGVDGSSQDALSAAQPLAGLRVGVFKPWFDDSEPAVAEAARGGMGLLSRLGAEVVAITLPELEQLRVASSCIILTEMFGTTRSVYEDPQLRPQLNEDSRIMLSLASRLLASHYTQGLRVRRRQSHHWARAFESCDVIATPGTAAVAHEIAQGAGDSGFMHLPSTAKLLRYSIQANVLGLPALVVPVGAVQEGGARLPTSLQLIGRPWQEATLMRVGAVLEAALAAGGGGAPPPALRMPNPLSKPEAGSP
ncbi:hypothetical protein MNEG_1064 [Monoraphidium neglectum]|uniref:Amidase domain-containing protein n=1 Tax=Monoraphidium neglectum TaxID=145388 RepID=A0A0D2NRF6_9CHLO|nr:hypothetical protein MNEG_1064 [Monoraphidium neglectum]KIZ06891.1 hypothetical protein MNEG_1064 [Monoraphidium neglectum]|eukprot:XP_013905910.1 hypothetical protein MNEG_1064 [Monoraphidium neglectum]